MGVTQFTLLNMINDDLNFNEWWWPLNILFFLPQSGSYRSYLVHEDLVVTERIDDIKPLGFYIRRLCDGKETYRMQRRASLPGMNELYYCVLYSVLYY